VRARCVDPRSWRVRTRLEARRSGNGALTIPSHQRLRRISPHPAQTQDSSTEAPPASAFITVLSDAYLVPREGRYAIFWRTSGRDLCAVEPDVAEHALRSRGEAVRLGRWSGTIRGRRDDWTLWWARGVPWASAGHVADGDQTLRLIEGWRSAAARAEARGQRWDPPAPVDSWATIASSPANGAGQRGRVFDGLRALLGGR
jgi:hypothetical protein